VHANRAIGLGCCPFRAIFFSLLFLVFTLFLVWSGQFLLAFAVSLVLSFGSSLKKNQLPNLFIWFSKFLLSFEFF
jgi:hypothetical protein